MPKGPRLALTHQRQMAIRRRNVCMVAGMVTLLVIATSLPLTLMMALTSDPCKRVPAGSSWLQKANPLSATNLCQIQRGMLSMQLPPDIDRNEEPPGGVSHSHGVDAGTATWLDGDALEEQRRAELKRLEALVAAAEKVQRSVGVDDVEMPRDDADIERILSHPHVDQCNLCKVCVPLLVVAKHPKAQRFLAGRAVHRQQSADEDILLDVVIPQQPTTPHQAPNGDTAHSGTDGGGGDSVQHGQAQQQGADGAAAAADTAATTVVRRRQQRALLRVMPGDIQGATAGDDAADARLRGTGAASVVLTATPAAVEGHGGDDPALAQGGSGTQGVVDHSSVIPESLRGVTSGPVLAKMAMTDGGGEALDDGGRSAMRSPRRQLGEADASESDGIYTIQGKAIDISAIAPGPQGGPGSAGRAALPNCTMCWGCGNTLEAMSSGSVMAGSYYAHEPGGSPSWLFRVRSSRTKSGWAVVKVWCVPVRKPKQRGLALCSPRKVYSQVKLLLAQQKVVHECGLNSIVPPLWVAPVSGVIPGHGFVVNWLGLWADMAEGISLQNIQETGNPPTPPALLHSLLTARVNSSEVAALAVFDLMFTQCDRHQQNIFMTEEGKLFAIDNDQVPGTAWRSCGVDSLVLPTTQKFMINHLGFFYVMKYPMKDPPRSPTTTMSPLLLLDYRCHVPGGEMGFAYPPQLKTCMRSLSSLSTAQIQAKYGYPSAYLASALRNRSADLLSQGFEWTLEHGLPRNQPMHRYKVAPPCCSMNYTTHNPGHTTWQCLDPGFKKMSELPYGNPWHGGPWHGHADKETGTYNGSDLV